MRPPELLALLGYLSVVAGVELRWGLGLALIVAGLPWPVGYVAHELRTARGMKRGG